MRPAAARWAAGAAAAILWFLFIATGRAEAGSGPVGAIAFVGTDSNIYYRAAKSGEPKCLTCATSGIHVRAVGSTRRVAEIAEPPAQDSSRIGRYSLPTFSPDGKRLAYASETRADAAVSFAVWVYDLAAHEPTRIFESHTERAIYVSWLRDGHHLSFLLGEPAGLSLMLAEPRESAPVRIVATGMPLFFDWGAAPGALAIHAVAASSDRTERVALMTLTPTSQNVDRVLSSGRTPFKTPCWSPDGKHLAYIANYHAESNIVVADADGARPRSIVSLPVGDNSFVWAPDSRHVAYSTALTPQNPVYHGIQLVDISDANSRWLTKDDVAAFFFSPDSRHLLYIGVPPDKPYYTWAVIDVKSGKQNSVGNFLATPEESTAYRYFDQLAVSHTIWSPDSSAFVYAGVRLLASPDRALGAAPAPAVWVVPIDGSAPRQIANGVIAFFSPAP